jgi:hypothetical protein
MGAGTGDERRLLSRSAHTRHLPRDLARARRAAFLHQYARALLSLSPLFTMLTHIVYCTHAGFLRQWPSLPTFGIFLTTRVLPVPHVEHADRYVVSRVEVLPGFYGVAQYLGFRDEAALHFDEIVARVGELEERYADPREADRRAPPRRAAPRARASPNARVSSSLPLFSPSKASTHGTPQHPALHAEEQELGDRRRRLTPIANYLRRVLIEDVSTGDSVSRPETHRSGKR